MIINYAVKSLCMLSPSLSLSAAVTAASLYIVTELAQPRQHSNKWKPSKTKDKCSTKIKHVAVQIVCYNI